MMHDIMKTLIEMTVYSSAMIVAVMALSKLFSDKISTKIIHALWIIALIRLLLPVTLESPYKLPITASFAAQEPAVAVAPTPVADSSFAGETTDIEYIAEPYEESPTQNTLPVQAAAPKAAKNIDIWAIVFAVWLIGALSYIAHNLYRIIIYNKKIKNIVSTDFRYANKLESTKKLLKLRRNIIIAESKYADIPFVYGYLRPKVLFPLGFFNAVDDEKLSYIVLHELSHIKRRDVAINYAWMAAKAIHWFNPLIYLAYKAYKNAVEECCDEAVAELLDTQGRCEYSQSLIDTMRFSKKRYYTPLSVSFTGKETAIRKRVLKMMYPQRKSNAILYITVLLASVMVLACFTTACQPAEAAQEDTQTSNLEQTQDESTDARDPEPTPTPEQTDDAQGLVEPDPTPVVTQKPEVYDTEMTEEEVLQIIAQLGLCEVKSIEFTGREDYFGNSLAHFNCKDGEAPAFYTFLEAIRSLVTFEDKNIDMTVPIELSDEQFKSIALDYAKKLTGNEDIEFTLCEASTLGPDDDFYYFGADGIISETGRKFSITLNGQGKLCGFSSYPTKVDMEKGVSIDEARQNALALLREQAHITDENNLTLISETLSTEYAPMFIFKYQYRSDNPTAEEYDYDCEVKVMAADGSTMGAGIKPVTSNIEVYSIEEAEQMAKEYIAKEGNIDASKLETKESWSRTDGDDGIMYSFMFDYNSEYNYSLMMTAAGEFWDIAGGPKN